MVNSLYLYEHLEIIKDFAAKDTRVRCIDSDNQGVSAARNIGLEMATGKYIGFADADDLADPEMYRIMYDLVNRYDADMAIGNAMVHDANGATNIRLKLSDANMDISTNRNISIFLLYTFPTQ